VGQKNGSNFPGGLFFVKGGFAGEENQFFDESLHPSQKNTQLNFPIIGFAFGNFIPQGSF